MGRLRQLPLWIAGAGLLAFVFYGVAEFQHRSYLALAKDPTIINATLDEIEQRPGIARLARADIAAMRPDPQLTAPETVLPRFIEMNSAGAAYLAAEESCALDKLDASETLAKWRDWLKAKCTHQVPPIDLVAEPPILHPAGGSWAAFMKAHQPVDWKSDAAWQAALARYSHLLELEENRGAPWMTAAVLPSQWQAILDGGRWVATRDHYWIPAEASLKIFERAEIDASLAMFGHRVITSETCTGTRTRGLCLVVDQERVDHKRALGLIALGAGILLLLSSTGLLLWQRRSQEHRVEEDRKMVMQTLAHELRHPATSLQLSLEVMRDQFDHLPPDSQTEFLRMLDQVQRLKRVLEASRQYLGSESGASGFQFKKTPVDDIGAFVSETLSAYEGKIRIQSPAEPRALAVDRYWLSLCLTNLVKNALIHGRQPIDVIVTTAGRTIAIDVRDQGSAPELSFEQMITPLTKRKESPGMGLGLSLVYRLMDLMGGKLEFQADPKTFRLRLEEEK